MERVNKLSTVPEFLKQHRKAHKLTQKQLSEYSEVSYSVVNRLENGDLNVSLGTLNKVLAVFGYELGILRKT